MPPMQVAECGAARVFSLEPDALSGSHAAKALTVQVSFHLHRSACQSLMQLWAPQQMMSNDCMGPRIPQEHSAAGAHAEDRTGPVAG